MSDMIHLAIADNHSMMRQSLISYISQCGNFIVNVEASNGKELLDKLELANHLPDICIMDIEMPVMNGYDATKLIAERFPNIKVLALTMYASDFNIIRMLQCGASGYLTKDSNLHDLTTALITINNLGFYSSPIITNALKLMVRSKTEKNSYILNEREIRFLSLCCTNLSYKEIAKKLCVSYNTLQNFIEEVHRKIHIKTRVEFAIFATRAGLTPF